MAVITNVPELIKATGDIDNLKIDDQDASRSIFYDSKGSSDAIKVLTDANNQYIANYHKANPTKVLKLADTVDTNDPIALANASFVTVTYKLADSNTNDAFALDPKNGLHEHANVNDNGGYDEDYWGKLNINDWNYTTNGDTITINGYEGNNSASLIIPNGADFDLANGQGTRQSNVEISSSVMHDLAKNATRIGLSKTENKKVAASDAIWQDAFGGGTNGPSGDNSDGGIKVLNPNLTVMDLHNLDTSNITDMSAMFNGGTNLKTIGDISDWDTGKITNMHTMFQLASGLTNIGDLSDWDTSKVTDMSYMFNRASNLTNIGDLSKWDTSKVTNMASMFYNAANLNNIGDLSKWQTGNVTNMALMFANATSLTNIGNLDNWNTSNVTDMSWMFDTDPGKQSHLTNIGDLSKWNTSKVTNMSYMFQNASSLTNIGKLDNWDTSNVTNMASMFYNVTNLADIGDLSKWQTGNVTNMALMFADATSLTNIGKLDDWDTSNVINMSWMFGTDYGKQSHLTNIGDLSEWNTSNVTDMSNMFYNTPNLTNIGDLSKWQTGNVTNMALMFAHATNLTNIGNLDNWNTNKVTNMSYMFYKTTNLTDIGDLSKWQTGNVTNMAYMFANATNLTNIGNLNNWDTSKVINMSWMFGTDYNKQSHLTNIGNLSKWQTGNVTAMNDMFYNATNLTNIGDLSKWQTGNVTDMNDMFYNATNLTNIGDLSKWQTGNVTDMHYMFANATNLTNIGDLSKWQTGNVTNMALMFAATKALRHLNISNWNLTKLANKNAMKYMFANDVNSTVIANDLKLPTWYQHEVNDADYFWNNHMAVITNVPELIKATGDINNLKIDKQDASRSIFYDSKGSSDAIKVLTDANQAYINKYEQDHPKYLLALDASVDQTDPIALANARFKTSHKLINVVQTNNSTRTIIVHLPNGTTQTMVQTIGLKRNAQKDLVTEIISSTAPWGLDEANSSYTINGAKQAQTAYKQNSNIITFSSIRLPKVPGYKAVVKPVANPVNPASALFAVSFIALPKTATPVQNDVNPAKTVTSATPVITEVKELIKTESKDATFATPKTIDLSNDVVATTPDETNWQVANEPEQDTYRVSNGKYTVELPHISNAQLHVITKDSTKDSVLFTYKGQNIKYVFNIKFVNGNYLLTTYEVKSGKLVKLIDYNFIKASKMSDLIRDWLKL